MQEIIDEALGRANTARITATELRTKAARLKAEAFEALLDADRKDARADALEAMAMTYQASLAEDGLCPAPLSTQGVGDRTVQHVETEDQDEEPAGLLPPHVWLYRNMLTDLQALAPLGVDTTNGQVAVAIDDLSDEQRKIPHVSEQLIRMWHDHGVAAFPAKDPASPENNTQSDAG